MIAIYKKELKSYFTSVIACLFIAITALIEGGFFVMYNLSYGTPYIIYAVTNALLIMVFTIPILTMRSLADERRQKTDQLILTAPVSVGKIVVGKYLALSTVYAVPMLITCAYPIILSRFGAVPLKMSYTEILGMLLYGLACIAIGMFISSITESQVIAAILSIVVLFVGYMMPNVTNTIASEGNILTKILGCFDLMTPQTEFLNGIISIPAIIYYVSIVVLFLFFTTQSIQKRKWSVSKNTISTGVFSTTFIAVAVVIAVFVNLIAGKISDNVTWASIDMTDQQVYTISDDTVNMLKNIDDEIDIYVIADKASADTTLDETLTRYKKAGNKINVEYKDVTKYPNFYKEYADNAPTMNSIVVVNNASGKSKVIDYGDIYETSSDYSTGSTKTTGYDGEGQLTSAISYVTSTDNPVIFQVTGHDENGVGASFVDAIEKMNIDIQEINLLNYEQISTEDCELIMLLSPQKDYSEAEAKKIIDYLKNGGRVLMTTSYVASGMDNFNSIAEYYGVKILNGFVAENNKSYFYQSPYYVLANNGQGYAGSLSNYSFICYAQGMYIDEESENHRDTIKYIELLQTTEDAVCKMNPNNTQTPEKEDGDVEGPFDLAISLWEGSDDSSEDSDNTDTAKTAKLTIMASNSAFTDEIDAMVAGSNLELFKNIISDYVDAEGEIVSVPVKTTSYSNLVISDSGLRLVGILVAIVLPLVILVVGIAVWTKRRKK